MSETTQVAPVERCTAAEWEALVDGSAHGSVFCRTALLDALDVDWEAWRLGPEMAARAGALVFRNRAGGVERAPIPFCLYQGLLVSGGPTAGPAHRRVREHLEATRQLIEGMTGAGCLSWCLHPEFTDVRSLSWFNYHAPDEGQFSIEVRYTGVIEADPAAGMEPILMACRSVRRQEYRKAGARFRVEPSRDLDLLDHLHGLTFNRQGLERSERERDLLRRIASAAIDGGFGELLVARDRDDTAAGAVLFLHDRRASYYLVAANDPAFRSTGVASLLFLSGVDRSLARGIGRIDVVGMNSPNRGDFKTSFGAVPIPYFIANWKRP